MFNESNNSQCLLIILLGVALFLLMRKPHRHGRMINNEPFYEGMEDGKSGASADADGEGIVTAPVATPAPATPMTDNGSMVVPVHVPERMPINEQAVGSCSDKPLPVQKCGYSLTESPTGQPYVHGRTDTVLDPTGVEGSGAPYNDVLGSNIPANHYFLDDGANGEMSSTNNMVSGSCCGAQWPTPFKQAVDPYVCGKSNEFTSSRTFGSNSYTDSGCICQTKSQARFLANRGTNGGHRY